MIPQNNSTPACSFYDPVVLRVGVKKVKSKPPLGKRVILPPARLMGKPPILTVNTACTLPEELTTSAID
jgi:hypothetical protein